MYATVRFPQFYLHFSLQTKYNLASACQSRAPFFDPRHQQKKVAPSRSARTTYDFNNNNNTTPGGFNLNIPFVMQILTLCGTSVAIVP